MRIDRAIAAAIAKLMAEAKVDDYRFDMGGKHPKLVFTQNGATHRYPLPGSPSDHRAAQNVAHDVRRLLGLTPTRIEVEELPLPEMVAAARKRVTANAPSQATAKDLRALAELDGDFVSALAIARRGGGAPETWIERLERLVALGLAAHDEAGRYRRV
ncbi:MAG: hypothetical protein HQL41_10030 [Alphaproteobacteria bacterium]|nr:hypothetical protein [Alphaproteobacteria bacterium]